ncbi:putative spore maturation protein [Pseudomonas aeruginosa]|nr:putative spore maturation protein [Pseudomonas aeruginosa]
MLNASSLTLLPVTIFMYRAQQGAADPTLVFLPILLATSASTLAGLLSVALMQRLRLWDPVVLAYLIPGALLLAGFMAVLGTLSATALAQLSSLLGNLTLFSLIVLFLIVGALKKVAGLRELRGGGRRKVSTSPGTCCRTWSQCFARLACCGASGALEVVLGGIRWAVEGLGWDSRFVEALPHRAGQAVSPAARRGRCCWRPCQTHGVDSFPALVAATVQGSTETTFYVLAVYFGSVGLQRARHAVGCALTADLAGVIASIGVCYWFFA